MQHSCTYFETPIVLVRKSIFRVKSQYQRDDFLVQIKHMMHILKPGKSGIGGRFPHHGVIEALK